MAESRRHSTCRAEPRRRRDLLRGADERTRTMLPLTTSNPAYDAIVQRLNRASVHKHADAYLDVPWEDPDSRIDPEAPCWELDGVDPLGATAWYRDRAPALRARIGLDTAAARMKFGIDFENILS